MKQVSDEIYQTLLQQTPKHVGIYVEKQMMIGCRIVELRKKNRWTNSQLAKKLEIPEKKLVKMLAGNKNLTLKMIAKFEAILGDDLIKVVKIKRN